MPTRNYSPTIRNGRESCSVLALINVTFMYMHYHLLAYEFLGSLDLAWIHCKIRVFVPSLVPRPNVRDVHHQNFWEIRGMQ